MTPGPTALYWLGAPDDATDGTRVASTDELPADLAAAVVVVAAGRPGWPDEVRDIRRRGGRAVACVADDDPARAQAQALCFSTRLSPMGELRRQVEALRVAPDLQRPLCRRFRFRTLDEAEVLAHLIAEELPNPVRRLTGLLELLLNAIEHGNLEISAAEKQALVMSGRWLGEVNRRLSLETYAHRAVAVTLEQRPGEWVLTIEDEGHGFDHAKVDFSLAPSQLPRGRGIALARAMSFDSIRFEGRGNRVVATVVTP